MGLSTTTIGALPKDVRLRRTRWQVGELLLEEPVLRGEERRALEEGVQLQERLGLSLLVDGQFDRGDMISFFTDALEGCEPAGLVRILGNRYARRPRVVDDVSRPGPITVDTWKLARSLSSRPVKAVVTGPYTLADWSFDEHYGARERVARAFAAVVAEEVRDLVEAGAEHIQIDEPGFSDRSDEIGWARECFEEATAPARGKARIWLQCCRGELAPIIDDLLRFPVDGIHLDLAHTEGALLGHIDRFPDEVLLGAGVIDTLDPEVEDEGTVRARAEAARAHVDADRLWLSPDAGMTVLDSKVAASKLEAMCRVAEAL